MLSISKVKKDSVYIEDLNSIMNFFFDKEADSSLV